MPSDADIADSTSAAGALPVRTRHSADPSPIGTAIALGGAVLGIIALGLPYWSPESARRAYFHLDEIAAGTSTANALNDNGPLVRFFPGWLFIPIAVWCAVSVSIAYRRRRTTEVPVIAGIATIVWAILAGLAADFIEGSTFAGETGSVGPGLGVYAELVAGLLMLVGGLLTLRSFDVQTLVAGSAATVLVAASIWWLAGLAEPLSPHAGMPVVGAPGGTLSEDSEYIADACRSLGVKRAAVRFGVAPTAEDAARAVAGPYDPPWWDVVYEGCLRGFRDRR
jgi:hypothetical protein